MEIVVEQVTRLEFADGSPVRAASAVARLDGGWLVAQDDATHAAWWQGGTAARVRVFPAVDGHETFEEEAGTKHLKPDLEAACEVQVDGLDGVLLLGSGSSDVRMRAALVQLVEGRPAVTTADLTPLYAAVAGALAVEPDQLNLEGACVVGTALRWFHRGIPSAGSPTRSVDLPLDALVSAVQGRTPPDQVRPGAVRGYDLGVVAGVGLAATDAVPVAAQAEDGPRLLVSAAAEDTADPRDDGPVVGSALVVLDDTRVVASAALPAVHGRVAKVEGLSLVDQDGSSARVLATVDADDRSAPSLALHLRLRW